MVNYFFVGLFILLSITSCRILEKKNLEKNDTVYIEAFKNKWESNKTSNYSFVKNESKTLILCIRRLDKSSSIDYSVYEIKTNKEIYSSGFIGSSIQWHNDEEIEIHGTSRLNTNNIIIINIITKRTRTINNKL